MERDRIFGMPVWMALVALGGAGLIGYLLFFRKTTSSADQGTTGYSSQGLAVMQNPDESATMALQNQELSILAQQLGGVSDQINAGFGNVNDALSSVNNVVSVGFGGLQEQMGGLSTQQSQLGGNIANLQNAQNAGATASDAYYRALITALSNLSNAQSGSQLTTPQYQYPTTAPGSSTTPIGFANQ